MFISKNPTVIADKIDDNYVLFNKENSKIFVINQIGYLIWESLFDGTDVDCLCKVVNQYTEHTSEIFLNEVLNFMDILKDNGLIKLTNDIDGVAMSRIIATFVKKIIDEQGYYSFKYHGLSMSSEFKEGQVIFVEPFDHNSVSVGDIVVFATHTSTELIIHRVIDIAQSEDESIMILTKGDDNSEEDNIVPLEAFVGKACVPKSLQCEKPVLRDDVVLRKEEDMTIIYDYSSQKMRILNEMGGVIVELFNGQRQLVEIVEEVLECIEDGVSYIKIFEDVEDFILNLKKEGYIDYV